jgi:hypothetical protein
VRHPVPDSILARIGDITVSFALLELQIQSLAGALIQDHQRISQIITAELSFKQLRALTTSLYLERRGEDADFETVRALMRRAADLEEKRNRITHSIWAAGATAETVTRIKTTAKEKRGIRFDFEKEVGEHDLAAIADDIKRLAGDVQRFWIDLIRP